MAEEEGAGHPAPSAAAVTPGPEFHPDSAGASRRLRSCPRTWCTSR